MYVMPAYFACLRWFYHVPSTWFQHPPTKPPDSEIRKACTKKLLLLAMLVGLRKVQLLATISPALDSPLCRCIRRATRGQRLMMTHLQPAKQTWVLLNALQAW
jgi:hypothetical protein